MLTESGSIREQTFYKKKKKTNLKFFIKQIAQTFYKNQKLYTNFL